VAEALSVAGKGKGFFFAKKKQKTSARWRRNLDDKSFLVLFFKKGPLAWISRIQPNPNSR
jgi:hypothetical protein